MTKPSSSSVLQLVDGQRLGVVSLLFRVLES